MRIGVIGGLERSESRLACPAAAAGHELEFHSGHMRGQGSACLERLIARVDLVIIITDVNSHGAVQRARQLAKRFGRAALLWRRGGLSRFQALLASLPAGGAGPALP
jgi:hypothetical protein